MDRHTSSGQAATSRGEWPECREEAEQLLGRQVAASEAALELGSLCSVAAITDGPNGSYISALGRLQVSTAHALPHVLLASALRMS